MAASEMKVMKVMKRPSRWLNVDKRSLKRRAARHRKRSQRAGSPVADFVRSPVICKCRAVVDDWHDASANVPPELGWQQSRRSGDTCWSPMSSQWRTGRRDRGQQGKRVAVSAHALAASAFGKPRPFPTPWLPHPQGHGANTQQQACSGKEEDPRWERLHRHGSRRDGPQA